MPTDSNSEQQAQAGERAISDQQEGARSGDGEKYANIPATPETVRELASTRDKLRAKNRELAAKLDELSSRLQEIEQAADEKAKAEGDWKSLLESREKQLSELQEQLEKFRSESEQLRATMRKRQIMDVVKPALAPGVSDLVVDAVLSRLESEGVVQVSEDADPTEVGRAYLDALAKRAPELIATSRAGASPAGGATGTSHRIDTDRLRQALQQAQMGSRVSRLLQR